MVTVHTTLDFVLVEHYTLSASSAHMVLRSHMAAAVVGCLSHACFA